MTKGSALEGFFAHYDGTGNSSVTVHETIETKVVLPYDQVVASGGKPFRGVPLGKLPDIYPVTLIREPLLEQTKEFVRQVKGHGFQPVTGIYAFKVWGPYMEKVGEIREWIPEADNPFIPHPRKAVETWLYSGDQLDWSKGCAYRIQGEFTRHASHGHVDEETGVVVV